MCLTEAVVALTDGHTAARQQMNFKSSSELLRGTGKSPGVFYAKCIPLGVLYSGKVKVSRSNAIQQRVLIDGEIELLPHLSPC